MIVSLLIILFLLVMSAFCSSSETALFSLPGTKVRAYLHSKDNKKKLIGTLLKSPQDLLVTIFILNTIVNVLLQNAVSSFVGVEGGWFLKVVVPFLLLLFFGEIFPKQYGLEKNSVFSEWVAPKVYFFQRLLGPIRRIAVVFTGYLSRILFFFLKKGDDISSDELSYVLKTSQEVGVLHPDEAELASGYLELQNSQVKEIMRPKEEILAYNLSEPITKLMYLLVDQECSKIPVYQGDLDHVVGIINASHYFLHRDSIQEGKDLIPFLEAPFYFPETAPAKNLFKEFENQNQVFSLVVNEYGVISGLITKEDLIEIVIGAITDRRDDTIYFTRVNQTTIIAKGQMELEDLEEIFSVKLREMGGVMTLGGWLVEIFGDIPKNGMTLDEGGLHFQILASDPNRVKKVFIQKRDL
ncbi:hemolysin family protein [Chlamydiales bacterium]|nr:hemolysin family protein [Chlamydiales bacterium]